MRRTRRLEGSSSLPPKPRSQAPLPQAKPSTSSGPELRSGGLLGLSSIGRSGQPEVLAAQKLRLVNSEGQKVEVPASSYYLDASGRPRASVSELVEVALSRDPRVQAEIDRRITSDHAHHEMSFKMKNPETGRYDRFFEVPSYGSVVPLAESHFRMLVKSTEPVMRALREMLQQIYSNPKLTAQDLGLGALSEEEQARVFETVRGSLYLEPKMIDPVMKDYPFLTVGGFDAAVGDLDRPDPVFFEYNLGTPSGLSNNVQLLDILRERDPELFRTFSDRLPEDRTFGLLRRAVESNALAWTKNPDGISVVIGPGTGNGAHPDVASIALFSGMPLVNPSDLYQDRDGHIRLNTGKPGADPAVTGIYGRMEESYFLQSSADGIPIRGPDFADAKEIGDKLGVALEPGIAYAFEYDENDEIVAVQTDAQGRPKLQEFFESMGRDPARPELPPASFAKAIKDRRLYFSGLGGRVVDDKRVFQAVSRALAKGEAGAEGAPIAHPPRTLDPGEYSSFYQATDLTRFVVKEPDNSGGVGVHLLCNLSPEKRAAVVASVKKNPGRYIVQEFAQPAVMLQPQTSESGKPAYGSSVVDWRLFVMLDAQGKISADPQSVLVRAAKPYSASTNTSQGAGYAIGVVLSDREQPRAAPSVLPEVPRFEAVGAGRRQDLLNFLRQLNWVVALSDPQSPQIISGTASVLAELQREVMDLLGRDFTPAMSAARSYDRGEIGLEELHERLAELRADLYAAPGFPAKGIEAQVRRVIRENELPEIAAASPAAAVRSPSERAAIRTALVVRALEPVVRVREDLAEGEPLFKFEVGRIESCPNSTVMSVLREVEAAGGEVRAIRSSRSKDGSGEWLDEPASAYFRVDEQGRPIIGIDLASERALSVLAHEREHFRMFQEHRKELMSARAELIRKGLSPAKATAEALDGLLTSDLRIEGERRAVAAEMKMDRSGDQGWNHGVESMPTRPSDPGFISRLGYPLIEGVRDLLHRHRWSGETLDEAKLETYLRELITLALESRKQGYEDLMTEARVAGRQGNAKARAKSQQDRLKASILLDRPIFETLFAGRDRERFLNDDTLDKLVEHFDRVFRRMPKQKLLANPADARRFLEQQAQAQ